MMRIRIEGLLAAFPKLLGTDSRQHTYIETESVRYIYQALMDNIYLLLITNRASNIIEDLDTLRLLSKVVPDIAGMTNNLTEDKIADKCFELIFAFDEVITTGGYREPITLQQIRTNLEMDSHEEKLHKMIKQSKIEQARDQANQAALSIKDKLKAKGGSMTGIGGGGSSDYPSPSSFSENRAESFSSSNLSTTKTTSIGPPARVIKGISLTGAGANKTKSLEQALMEEDKLAPVQVLKSKTATSSDINQPSSVIIQHPVMLQIIEKVSAKISRDGTLVAFDIKGSLTLTASNDDSALCCVQMNVGEVSDFVFTTHPKVNKVLYDKSGLIQLKDTTKGFPSARPVGVLKWTHTGSAGSEDALLPLKVNCWPDEEARGVMNVSIEYSKEIPRLALSGLKIKIPLGTSATPQFLSVDGSHKHNASSQELIWEIPLVDESNSSGTMEFTIAQKSADAFFPIQVEFSSSQLFCELEVGSVRTADGKSPILYGLTKSMSTEEYIIE